MALAFSSLTTGTAASAASAETAAISPAANSGLLLAALTDKGSTSVAPSVSGLGLTWTRVTGGTLTGFRRLDVYRAVTGGSPATGTVTLDYAGVTQEAILWTIDQAAGADTSALVVQAKSVEMSSGVQNHAVANPVASGNLLWAAIADSRNNASVTPSSNFTQLSNVDHDTPDNEIWTQYANSGVQAWDGTTSAAGMELVLLEIGAAAAVAGTMLYLLDSPAAGSNFGTLQLGGSPPADATTSTRWIVDGVAAGQYALMEYGATQTTGEFTGTSLPNAGPSNAAGDCWRSGRFAGPHSFAAGLWTVTVAVIAMTSGGTQDGALRVRFYKGAAADGSDATPLQVSGADMPVQQTTGATDLTTATPQPLAVSFTADAFDLDDEFLFLQLAWVTA